MKKSTLVKALEKGICILVMLVVLIPFIWMVCMAFKTDAEIMSFPPTFFSKGNHIKAYDINLEENSVNDLY